MSQVPWTYFRLQFVLQVGIPYLRAKAQDYYEELGGGVSSDLDEGLGARQLQALTEDVGGLKNLGWKLLMAL